MLLGQMRRLKCLGSHRGNELQSSPSYISDQACHFTCCMHRLWTCVTWKTLGHNRFLPSISAYSRKQHILSPQRNWLSYADSVMSLKKQAAKRAQRRGEAANITNETPASSSSEQSSDSSDFEESRPKKRARKSTEGRVLKSSRNTKGDNLGVVSIKDSTISSVPSLARKSPKKAKYDFSTDAGSPFPNWPAPTVKEIQVVFKLLEDKHGKIEMSQARPSLGLLIEGCNDEEPALIDAIIRARLSAGTNDMNASRAFMGILNTFGRRNPGHGIGIVDWEAVRLAPVEDLYEAIKTGGMGNVKSRSLKAILDMVHDENVVRQGQGEISNTAEGIDLLSLEYMRSLSKDEAFAKFVSFPGVGPKTAACVISICMQHNSFAVDTHVYRICTWLGWVPSGTDRDGMFAHLETRIPSHLKFDLHYLMIRHGRACKRCQANTSPSSTGWEDANCPLEGLVNRNRGKRQS